MKLSQKSSSLLKNASIDDFSAVGLIALIAVHPGKLTLLELVQLPMKLHRADSPARGLVDLLLALESPIVRIAGRPGVLLAGRDLLVIQVQFGAIAPCDLHDGFPPEVLEKGPF